MSILINKDTKVLVQGITGKSGSLQAKAMLDAGADRIGASAGVAIVQQEKEIISAQ